MTDTATSTEHSSGSEPPYRRFILEAAPRLLGQLDREPLSPTWGSFDRDHWAWKFRDFPINMLQFGLLPLSWLHQRPFADNPYAGNASLLAWLSGGLEALLGRQHRNGAFDTVGPYTQDHGVTLAMAYTVATLVDRLGDALADALRSRAADSVHRACAFAGRSDEDYAFISNHQALFALAWLRAGRLLGDDALIARGDHTMAEILRQQSSDGWYREYGGPDPGYESLGILYLAQVRTERPSPALDASLQRALEFHAHCVHPDGSVGGGYASRHTSLWYPGGFELLSREFPQARAVARFLRARLDAANVVTPATVDPHNLPSLLNGYTVAADATRDEVVGGDDLPPLPFERTDAWHVFNESGIVVAAKPHYYAIANLNKGGALVVFDRATSRLAYEDAGYVIRSGGHLWNSALLGAGEGREVTGGGTAVTSSARFGRADREVLTPFKFVVLRLLNLTVFRSVALGAVVRRMIIARLVTSRRDGPFRLLRRLDFSSERVEVRDEVVADEREGVTGVWRPRAFTAVHMGSARYFSGRDLVDASGGAAISPEHLAPRLGRAGRFTLRLVISCAAGRAPSVTQDDTPDA